MNDKVGGILMGIVVDTNDPAGYKRIRVRIPAIHGSFTDKVYPTSEKYGNEYKIANRVDDNALPWIPVCYPFGSDIPPEVNQVVYVAFLSGDKDNPVVIGWLGYDYTNKEYKVTPKVYTKGN